MPLHWLAMRLIFLDNAQIFDSIEEAVNHQKSYMQPLPEKEALNGQSYLQRKHAQEIHQLANEEINVSILFGREDRGLTNEELQMANKHLIIPADPEYPVLNIAMSTQVVCYELYQATQQEPLAPWQDFPEYTAEELNHLD